MKKLITKIIKNIELTLPIRSYENLIGSILKDKHKTLATTESCTGGLISSLLTDVSGSSEYIFANFVTEGLPKPGNAEHGGVDVVSVEPTFSAVQSVVLDVITNLVNEQAVSKQEVQKPYKKLFGAIEDVLKTAVCTITEAMSTTPPSTSSFPENLQ